MPTHRAGILRCRVCRPVFRGPRAPGYQFPSNSVYVPIGEPRNACPFNELRASGLLEGSHDDSDRDRPKREESRRKGRFAGLAGHDAERAGRAGGIVESLVPVGPNDPARQDVLTGRISSESVSLAYAHWSKCCCDRKVYILIPDFPDENRSSRTIERRLTA